MDVENHEVPFNRHINLQELVPQGIANRQHASSNAVPEYETFTMKKTYPKLVNYFYLSGIVLMDSYNNIRKLVLSYCAQNRIIISRIQLETVEINLPGHVNALLNEAVPLVTASQPPLASLPPAPPGTDTVARTLSPISVPTTPILDISVSPDALQFDLSLLSGHEFVSPNYSPLSVDWEDA